MILVKISINMSKTGGTWTPARKYGGAGGQWQQGYFGTEPRRTLTLSRLGNPFCDRGPVAPRSSARMCGSNSRTRRDGARRSGGTGGLLQSKAPGVFSGGLPKSRLESGAGRTHNVSSV